MLFYFLGYFYFYFGYLVDSIHHTFAPEKREMNKFLSLLLIITTNITFAQSAKQVITNGGTDDVYFSFITDEVKRIDRSTWDIAFTLKGFDASILINENAGVELYLYGNDINAWNSLDTTGISWVNSYNSEDSWSQGAFANQGTTHPDYGWGVYTQTNHDINGDRIFIIKLVDNSYKQIMIEKMSAAGVYTVKIADIGGANTATFTVNKMDASYADKNFVLYSLVNNAVVNEEPVNTSWDLLFTKYTTLIPAGPSVLAYSVSGVKVNAGYEVAERTGVVTASNDTSMLVWDTKITEIGSDWKTFNNTTFAYEITEDLTYFVRSTKGDVWKIFFTDYKGGTEGGFYFNVERIAGSASTEKITSLNSAVYPNPATSEITVVNNENSAVVATITDLQGRIADSFEIGAYQRNTVNTADLARGMYIVVFTSENATSSKRIILE